VTVGTRATDEVSVVRSELYLDNQLVATSEGSQPATYAWDTRAIADGDHRLEARAWDEVGHVGTDIVFMTVLNAPASHDLVVNGGFDHGFGSGWAFTGSPMYFTQGRSTLFSLALGVGSPPVDPMKFVPITPPTASQRLWIPPGTTSATLSFWVKGSVPAGSSSSTDWQEAALYDETGNLLQTLLHESLSDMTWTQRTADLLPYAGTVVELRFTAQTSASPGAGTHAVHRRRRAPHFAGWRRRSGEVPGQRIRGAPRRRVRRVPRLGPEVVAIVRLRVGCPDGEWNRPGFHYSLPVRRVHGLRHGRVLARSARRRKDPRGRHRPLGRFLRARTACGDQPGVLFAGQRSIPDLRARARCRQQPEPVHGNLRGELQHAALRVPGDARVRALRAVIPTRIVLLIDGDPTLYSDPAFSQYAAFPRGWADGPGGSGSCVDRSTRRELRRVGPGFRPALEHLVHGRRQTVGQPLVRQPEDILDGPPATLGLGLC